MRRAVFLGVNEHEGKRIDFVDPCRSGPEAMVFLLKGRERARVMVRITCGVRKFEGVLRRKIEYTGFWWTKQDGNKEQGGNYSNN